MAFTARLFALAPRAMFDVLVDPTTYPHWLIGATEVRDVDQNWPARGSRFHHRVGIGPLSLPDSTQVVACEPPNLLKLHVRARPLVSAYATFRVLATPDGCVVTLEEEPAVRSIGNLVRPVLDPLVHVRNHRSLRRLALLLGAAHTRETVATRQP